MEVPVIHRFNNFQTGLDSIQNPSFLLAYSFCKWGALILALIATFGSIINRIKILIIRFRRDTRHSLPSFPLLSDDDYSSDDDDDDGSSSEYEEDEEDEPTPSSSCFIWRETNGDFRVRGSVHQFDDQLQNDRVTLRRRRSISELFSLSEITNGQSVVKLWENMGFGLGLNFDGCDFFSGNVNSIPAVVVSAGENDSGNLELKVWDNRLRRRTPAVAAEWGPQLGKIVGVGSGGVKKVCVTNDIGSGVTVGDMRNVTSPLMNVTERDMDKWWDADAVILSR